MKRLMHRASKRHYSWIKEFDPDFILASFVYPDGFAALRISEDLNIPFAIQALGSDIKIHSSNASRRKMISRTLRSARKVFSVSEDLAEDMRVLGARSESLVVNYNGVDKGHFRCQDKRSSRTRIGMSDGDRENRKLVLFVGNLLESKGIFELIDAIVDVNHADRAVHLAVIGIGPAQSKLAKFVKDRGIDDMVDLIGYVPNSELPEWYSSADLLCLPSYSEGVPNVVMESLSCGTPVAASSVGGIPEIVNSDNGLLFAPRSSAAISGAISAALSREWNSQTVSQTVSNFTWERYSETLCTHLRELC